MQHRIKEMPVPCRVYKTFDPRAKVMQNICHQLFKQLNIEYAHTFSGLNLSSSTMVKLSIGV